MKQEEKELLLKDLCGRTFYGVMVDRLGHSMKLLSVTPSSEWCIKVANEPYIPKEFRIEDVKPYLRPMSSMTEEEEAEICGLIDNYEALYGIDKCTVFCSEITDWLNAHHFDYRGLIEKGLAIEAPEGMYKINRNKL